MSYEPISVFDIFKIGVGPSSSHTLGPWRAAQQFLVELEEQSILNQITGIQILLFGSLAKTGIGHGTDIAVQMGLTGADPVTVAVEEIHPLIQQIKETQILKLAGKHSISFQPKEDIVFLMSESLPFHSNALQFQATLQNGENVSSTFYSIGGGFVVKEGATVNTHQKAQVPFPVNDARDLLQYCIKTGMAIHELVMENETAWRSEAATKEGVHRIWEVMLASIYRGCHTEGFLPGGLHVKRRAAALNKRLIGKSVYNSPQEWIQAIKNGGNDFAYILDWVSCFALAVNEENASFGRVVTAPTNGAAGVVPAVLMYYLVFVAQPDQLNSEEELILRFICTAAEIGSIFKKGATISAAMGGCQAEIGVSSAMAAAALAESMGGSQRQAMMAAEIAMEHHLGLTCDPIGGLVQVPCIERNTMGAIKAITAAQLALQSTPDFAKVSLDAVIKTMWDTAQDMSQKYKETADGGLAVHVPLSLAEC